MKALSVQPYWATAPASRAAWNDWIAFLTEADRKNGTTR